MELMRIMSKCEHFNHRVQDHHNSETKQTRLIIICLFFTRNLKRIFIVFLINPSTKDQFCQKVPTLMDGCSWSVAVRICVRSGELQRFLILMCFWSIAQS